MKHFSIIALGILLGLFLFTGHYAVEPLSAATKTKSSPLIVKTIALPAWISGTKGSFKLEAHGGNTPYTWILQKRSLLPKGFALNKKGTISGTFKLAKGVTKRVSAPFTIIVKDKTGKTKTLTLTLTVVSRHPVISVSQPATLTVDKTYSNITLATATDGMQPYSFVHEGASGALPFGMQIMSSNGAAYLSGTPRAKGTYRFRVCVVDNAGSEACDGVTVIVLEAVKVRINISLSGSGGGRWKADNGTCIGSGCLQLELLQGETVTFTATPNSDSTFDGWNGACTGAGSCVVIADADTSIAGIFTLRSQNSGSSSSQSSANSQGDPPASPTNSPQPGSVTISSATCTQLDRYGGNLEHLIVNASGITTGPVGMSFNVYTIIEDTMDCGTWTKTPGKSGSGSRCKRAEGQPETTNWDWKSSIQGIFINGWSNNSLTVEAYNEKDMSHYYTQYEKANPCP